MKTNKKGMGISPPEFVVGVILLLAVLVILLFIFSEEAKNFARNLGLISDETMGKTCASWLYSRTCDCGDYDSTKYTCDEVPYPPGISKWKDCDGGFCYELVKRE